jgi:dolichol-phosphate mannosyltransferase
MTPSSNKNWTLSIIAPVFNEEASIEAFIEEVLTTLQNLEIPGQYQLILVNDGSTDRSSDIIEAACEQHPDHIKVIHLARNFGLEPAISAGLDHTDSDATIIMDSDMQDDPAIFQTFIDKWQEGSDVVYAVRTSRQESAPRRFLFWAFYRLLSAIACIDLPRDAGNFALMDRKVVDALRSMNEQNRFLRGLRAWVGFKQVPVEVARRSRYDDETRLGLRGQWKLAMNAIFAFSYVPLFLFRLAGAITLAASTLLILWVLYHKLIIGLEIKAWASQLIVTTFLGGINLLGIGIVGEYVARIHDEVKGRPNYIVREVVTHQEKK